ncbi:MAG TPA: ferritin family protein [Thermoanaerobaculia bacterium]|nr:ferritin family protein [Thermoanaerobaculia bacterium]HUM30389.1 ferritin family protein [Thermoanaerobaculia bacterium]HXK68600.1 ferritin family protein [Thermoanaerobaculia bacterium]
MNKPCNELAPVLLEAIHAEEDSSVFYRMMADMVQDSDLKQEFLNLSAEEESHAGMLREIIETLPDVKQDCIPPRGPESQRNLFDLETRSLEDLYRYAIKTEREARDHYEHCATLAATPEQADLLKRLALFEQRHVNYLQARLDSFDTSNEVS